MTEQEWLSSEDPTAMLAFINTNRGDESGGAVYPRTMLPQPFTVSDRKLRLFSVAKYKLLEPSWVKYPEEVAKIERWIDGGDDPLDRSWHLGMDATSASMFYLDDEEHRSRFGELAALLRDICGNPFRSMPCFRFDGRLYPLVPVEDEFREDNMMPVSWITPLVVSLAQAAYEERGGPCKMCCGTGLLFEVDPVLQQKLSRPCHQCHGTGRIDDGTLCPVHLAVLADALEQEGCTEEAILMHLRGQEMCWMGNLCPDEQPYRPPGRHCSGWRSLRGPHVRGCWVVDLVLGKD